MCSAYLAPQSTCWKDFTASKPPATPMLITPAMPACSIALPRCLIFLGDSGIARPPIGRVRVLFWHALWAMVNYSYQTLKPRPQTPNDATIQRNRDAFRLTRVETRKSKKSGGIIQGQKGHPPVSTVMLNKVFIWRIGGMMANFKSRVSSNSTDAPPDVGSILFCASYRGIWRKLSGF
jgi:hypothetical protein